MGRRHVVIPDMQLKPGVPTEQITWIADYIVDKKPNALIQIGDWADMASLSSYDKGKKSFEGRTYEADIRAANDGLDLLMRPIEAEMERIYRRHLKRWDLEEHFTEGNHEHRITRAVEEQRELEGTYSLDHLNFKKWGFKVHPFLEPAVIDGIAYAHYFTSGAKGQPITTARALLTKVHMSCFAGHQQTRDIAYGKRADGRQMTAIIAGSAYQHTEEYLGAQGNKHWRGIYMLNEVEDGAFDEMPISLRFLKERYERKHSGSARR